MEDIVDLPGNWQLEVEDNRGDGFDDLKWPIAFGVELRHMLRQLEMGGFQPYLVADSVLCPYWARVLCYLSKGLTSFFSAADHFLDLVLSCLVCCTGHV